MRWWLAATAILAGCARGPEFYAPPPQYGHSLPPGRMKPWFPMNDPDAPLHLVRGVGPLEGDRHRWIESNAVMKFHLPVTSGLRFSSELSVSINTFPKTGPVTVVFRINGREFDRVRYDSAGERRYEKAVAEEWLRPGENTVAIETSPAVKTPEGVEQALALFNAGFIE